MDLSPVTFRPAEPPAERPLDHPPDWAALVALAWARQSVSPTALAQGRLLARCDRPGGAFAPFVAAGLAGRRE